MLLLAGAHRNEEVVKGIACLRGHVVLRSIAQQASARKSTFAKHDIWKLKQPRRRRQRPILSIILHAPLFIFWFAQERGFSEAREA